MARTTIGGYEMSTKEDILPCQFCGFWPPKISAKRQYHYVICPSCLTRGPKSKESNSSAVVNWNSFQHAVVEMDGELFIPMKKAPKKWCKLKFKSDQVIIQNDLELGSTIRVKGLDFLITDFNISVKETVLDQLGQAVKNEYEITIKGYHK